MAADVDTGRNHNIERPTHIVLNHMLTQVILFHTTAEPSCTALSVPSSRINGALNVGTTERCTNLVPYPRNHITKPASRYAKCDSHHCTDMACYMTHPT